MNNKYPEFVRLYKPKGSIVKKVRDTYYVYKATFKRVEGKKYPVQVIEGLLGKVDEYGFHKCDTSLVNTTNVIIRECGFTNYLLLFEDVFIKDKYANKAKKDAYIILYSLIVYLSANSYLIDQKKIKILDIDTLSCTYKLSLSRQIKMIEKVCGIKNIKDIENLKYICKVQMGNRTFNSSLSNSQLSLIESLGVNADELFK